MDAGNIPASTTNVFLTATNQSGAVSTHLGASTTINSLNINSSAASNTVTDDGSTLTINALADGNGNAAGNGITAAAGSGPAAINTPVVLGGSGVSQTWTNASSNALTINGNVTGTSGTQTLTIANSGTGSTTLNGVISNSATGSVALTINSAGTGATVFAGASTYTGTTTVTAGTLQFGDGTSGHDGVNIGSTQIVNNGSVIFNRAADSSYGGVISGSGSLTVAGNSTLTLTGVQHIHRRDHDQHRHFAIGRWHYRHFGTLASPTIVDNAALAFNTNGTAAYNGVISGGGTVTILGTGVQVFTGANIYTSDTNILSGATLRLGDGNAGHDGTVASANIIDNGTLGLTRSGTSTYGWRDQWFWQNQFE